jgi:hypothetical protein
MNLKGVPEPVTLFRLIRASGGGSRAGQRHLTALVGRDEEIAMLMRRWERARHGDGQLMLIVSEAGLGKSRLIEEFHARLSEVTHTWVEWGCGQLLQNTPLHPIAEWGRIRFGGTDVPADQRLADLESALAQIKLDLAENAAMDASLVDVSRPADRIPALSPEELRRRQLAALINWVMAGARVQPIKPPRRIWRGLTSNKTRTMCLFCSLHKGHIMVRSVVTEALALASITLFLAMIAVWAQVLAVI